MSEERSRFEPEQEVRFAVVMYGGVSLAIYINGVAQELFRLVRSTAPARQYVESEKQDLQNRVFYPDDELTGSEPVYRALGRLLGLGDAPAGDAIRTRFVVDILSGTSAGGINGVLLGLALAQQKDFRLSSELWRKVADIDALLREEASFEGLPADTPRDSESLLNGYRLYFKARDAMDDMPAESPEDPWRPAFVEQLDLAVTATDLAGLPQPVRLTETRSIDERMHRKVFRFSYGTKETTGEQHSDFEKLDLMLGFAARATSSFPFAFEPVLFRDVAALQRPGKPVDTAVPLDRFFRDDMRGGRSPETLAYADGGYLDNKPFSYATEALRSRRADVPVTRKLVYIEPHPTVEGKPPKAAARSRPDVIGNVVASMTLPRYETIREDVAAVSQRNLVVERLRELGLHAERGLDRLDPLAVLRGADAAARDDAAADELLGLAAPAYAAYRTLRVRTVLDALASLGAELRRPRRGDALSRDVTREVRLELRRWIEAQPEGSHGAFLAGHDVAFQQRRLSFLHDRVNDLLRARTRAARMVAVAQLLGTAGAPAVEDPDALLAATGDASLPADAAAALAEQAEPLRDLKLRLNEGFDQLRRAVRAPQARALSNVLSGDALTAYEALRDAAQGLPDEHEPYMEAAGVFLGGPLGAARAGIKRAIREAEGLAPWIRDLLDEYDDRFEAYDMVVLPLAYPDLGEANAVGIVRISPLDAPEIAPTDQAMTADPTLKLAGIRAGHFGGFLEASWRDNDLMWGRLDAAEVIIDTLLGPDDPRRTALRVQAQAAILREELRGPLAEQVAGRVGPLEAADDAALVKAFREAFKAPGPLEPSKVDSLASRSLRIGTRLLADAADGRGWPSLPLRGAGLFGPTMARVALPASRGWGKVKRAPKALVKRIRGLWPFGG